MCSDPVQGDLFFRSAASHRSYLDDIIVHMAENGGKSGTHYAYAMCDRRKVGCIG